MVCAREKQPLYKYRFNGALIKRMLTKQSPIYLVIPPAIPAFDIPKVPFSILALGSYLITKGYTLKLFDGSASPHYKKELLQAITDNPPLFVGFSVMTPSVGLAVELTKDIKRLHPDVRIAWGGPHAALFPEQIIESNLVDIVCLNEGELFCETMALKQATQQPLINIPDSCQRINGRIVKNKSSSFIDVNTLPPLAYDLLDIPRYIGTYKLYNKTYRHLGIIAGYGCPYRCSFCINVVLQRKHRGKSSERILEEIRRAHKLYGITYFPLMDEFFFDDIKRVNDLVTAIMQLEFKIIWRVQARADSFRKMITKELLTKMKLSGCCAIGIGAESGSQRILNAINKGITVEDIIRSNRMCNEARITITNSFMIGIPGEELTDVIQTARLCDTIMSKFKYSIIQYPQLFRPYPGSPLYEKAVAHQLQVPRSLEEWKISQEEIQKRLEATKVDTLYFSYKDSTWIKEPQKTQSIHKIIFRRWNLSKIMVSYTLRDLPMLLMQLPLMIMAYIRIKINFWQALFIDEALDRFDSGLIAFKHKLSTIFKGDTDVRNIWG